MRNLYKFCKLYNLDIEVKCDETNNDMIFRFYNRKTKQIYQNRIPCFDIENIKDVEIIEKYLYENAIEALELDKTLWTGENRVVVCDRCKGSGMFYPYIVPVGKKSEIICPYCNGKGYTYIGGKKC